MDFFRMAFIENGNGYFTISESSISGKGLFADVNIPENTILFQIHDHIIKKTSVNDVKGSGFFKISINEQECYVINRDESSGYINHNCSPNVILIENLELYH